MQSRKIIPQNLRSKFELLFIMEKLEEELLKFFIEISKTKVCLVLIKKQISDLLQKIEIVQVNYTSNFSSTWIKSIIKCLKNCKATWTIFLTSSSNIFAKRTSHIFVRYSIDFYSFPIFLVNGRHPAVINYQLINFLSY